MKSYCVRQRKFTNSILGSEKVTRSKNGKLMIKSICAECGAKKSQFMKNKENQGGSIDIHKLIGKLPRPKSGFTPSKYKYMGPYNLLDKQVEYDPNTGEVQKWHVNWLSHLIRLMRLQLIMIYVTTWGAARMSVMRRWYVL